MAPLALALLPLAAPILRQSIKLVEGLFGPKTGKQKMEAVIASAMPILQQLVLSGVSLPISDQHPRDTRDALELLAEILVQAMKSADGSLSTTSGRQVKQDRQELPEIQLQPGQVLRIADSTLNQREVLARQTQAGIRESS